MLTRFFRWLGTRLGIQRRLSLAERRCARAELAFNRSIDRVQVLKSHLEVLQLDVAQEVKGVERNTRVYEDALAALRAQLEVSEEITIPALTAAHKLMLARIDGDTAIQVRRQATPLQGEL